MKIKDLLLESQRIKGSRKSVTIIDPDHFEEFFNVLDQENISLHIKTLIMVSVSGGLRVSEALGLKLEQFDLAKGQCRFKVLKKRDLYKNSHGEMAPAQPVYRTIQLHPIALKNLKELIKQNNIQNFSKVFSFSRQHVFNNIKKIFGENACPHSIARHSHITWLLKVKGNNSLIVSRMMAIDLKIVERYNHINQKKEVENLYKEAA